MLGVLLIDKPLGITSHDVVAVLRRRLKTKRVGHAGTLDPLATGLLVVAIGPATRFLQYLPLEPKVYRGHIQFGEARNTQDAEGEVTESHPVPGDLPAQVSGALEGFRGLISQIPPMFSAVKKNGQPLYVLARQGQEIEREPRRVHISSFDLDWEAAELGRVPFEVVCSGGTYVRTLVHDLGQAVGCGAYLASLCRTSVGRFDLGSSVSLEDASEGDLIPLREALPPMPLLELNATQQLAIRQGQVVGWQNPPGARHVGLVDGAGEVFGVARVEDPYLQPEVVIPVEAAYGSV